MPENPLFHPTARQIPPGALPTKRLLPYMPQLPLAERDRRWDRIRKRMLTAGIDCLLLLGNDIYWGMGMANMRYVLNADSQLGGIGLFPVEGEPVLWNGVPHMQRPTNMYLSTQEWITDIRVRGPFAAIVDEMSARGFDRGRIGLVGFSSVIQTTPTLLHDEVVAVRKNLADADIVDATPMLQQLRMVKSEAEIDMLRGAGRIARKVVDAMRDTARPGVTEAAVYAEMIRTQIANGAEPNIFNLMASGPVEHAEDELWHLLHGCEQPLTPSMRPLEEGDIVSAEWHTKFGGYRCHTEYSVYLGKEPPRELARIWDVSVECLEASKEALTAGRTIREAVEMIRKPADKAGLDWVELGFHAMGVASPEFPTVIYREGYGSDLMNGSRVGNLVLEEGMAFGNNIDMHDSRWKHDVGCMLADFMIVRPGRAECLVGTPTEFPSVSD